MESLTPDREELEAHQPTRQSRRKKRGGNNGSGGKNPSSGGIGWGHVGLWLLVLLLAGGGGWLLWEQHQTLNELEQKLVEAQTWINETGLSLARFEGALDETGEEFSHAGEVIQDKLDFLESEMRKLWVIAYERNRPAVQENRDAMETLRSELASLEDQVEQAAERAAESAQRVDRVATDRDELEQAMASLRERVDSAEGGVESVDGRLSDLRDQLNGLRQDHELTQDELNARLGSLASDLEDMARDDDLEGEVAGLRERLDEMDEIVESIDSARSQLTRRFMELRERVERMSRDMDNS